MKQRVDLYLLAADTFKGCFHFVCQLVEKTVQQGHAPVIQLESAEAAESLDQLLWTFRDTSFIPHHKSTDPKILTAGATGKMPPLVINCRLLETPEPLDERRLLQIVPNQPELLQLARRHYRFYQQQGCELVTHQIK